MTYMNEYEIQDAAGRFRHQPVLSAAVETLYNLMEWVNCNSDGWPYWQPPRRAATKLMDLILSVDRFDPRDITEAEYKAAVAPIKAFRTKANKPHAKWGIREAGTCDFEIVTP